jgi:hypothetical protein
MSEPSTTNGSDTSRIFPRTKLKNLRFFSKSRVKMKNPLIPPKKNLKTHTSWQNNVFYQFYKKNKKKSKKNHII